jgi:PmbA protein
MSKPALPSHSKIPLTNQEQTLYDISERVLEIARQTNCSAADLHISQVSGAEYSVRNGEPETIERNQDKGLEVRVFVGDKTGSASTTDFSDVAIESTVKAAASIAGVTEGDACQRIAPPELNPQSFPDLELHHPHNYSADALSQFALEQAVACEAAALGADSRISNSEGASFSAHEGISLTRNSNDFTGFSRGTRYGLSCSVIAGPTDAMQRDYWYDSRRKLEALDSPESIGRQAADRVCQRLNARKISTCRAPIILDASIAPGLLGHLMSALAGNAIYKNASFLAGKMGEMLFPEHINIIQHPHLKQGMGSAIYDAEGVATRQQNYIDRGHLVNYVLGLYSACKLGMQTTGNAGGVRNLSISDDNISRTDLLKRMHSGLLVTELMGFGVNTVTGDYSRGAAGFWVENGEIQYPVHEITLSGQLPVMFKGINGVANDTNLKGNIHSGSILIDQMTIGGN